MTMGHNPEQGHKCPTCGAMGICTIEYGRCEGQGDCETCRKQAIYDQMDRRDREEAYDYD